MPRPTGYLHVDLELRSIADDDILRVIDSCRRKRVATYQLYPILCCLLYLEGRDMMRETPVTLKVATMLIRRHPPIVRYVADGTSWLKRCRST